MSADEPVTPPCIASMERCRVGCGSVHDELCWESSMQRVDVALASGDVGLMLRAWHAACLEALGSQGWEPMLRVGAAALRIGPATGFAVAFGVKARQAFDIALYRALKAASVEGVLRTTEGFASLGDYE